MRFGILGPLEVVDDRGRQLAIGGRKPSATLAILIVHRGEPVSGERLADELWEERAPATSAKTVQVYISRLRKALGKDLLHTRGEGYALSLDPEQLDADRFERLGAEGREALGSGDPVTADKRLREALGLWRGEPLADFRYEPFAQAEIARLQEARLTSLEDRIDADLALGRHNQLVAELEALTRAQPRRERLRGQLMLALYRSGRQLDALETFRLARHALIEELGIEPGRQLRELHQAILEQHPRLDVPGATPAPSATQATSISPTHLRTDTLRQDPSLARRALTSGSDTSAAAEGVDTETAATADVRVSPQDASASAAAVASVDRPAGSARRRKVVTALFCDASGSTRLGEELDPETLHRVMNGYWRELRSVIERHGGTVDKFIGDAVMAVFGIPRVHEDDAVRAVRAAAEIRERLPAVAEDVGVALSFRTAVNTGLVLVGEGENLAIGDAVNVAARLEQAASPSEILLGEETFRLVRDAVKVEPVERLQLKGKSRPVRAFRLLSVDPVAPGIARRFDVPLVGRQDELALLAQAWRRVVRESGCHLFTLLGAAGVGKSRLVAELLARIGEEATILRGRCLHYGEGITFWPVVEALMPLGPPARAVVERLGIGGSATPQELLWEVRRLLESLAAERPVIFHIDDLQWAEEMLLDLLDHVVDLSRGKPILVIGTARPELLEDRPGWGGGKLNATSVLLEPLDTIESDALLDELGDGLDPDARARVIAASEGNPLFLEEMVALAREHETVEVPPTIQALLAARLEQLGVEERELLERGAVEGEIFHTLAVRALADEQQAAQVELRLAGLVRKELIRPHPPTLDEDEAYRFRHLLLRDAAYDGLPKAERAELHERFARWLENGGAQMPQLDEIAGWHLERAVRYCRELGLNVERQLERTAAKHLRMAARHASGRNDAAAATNLLDRALSLSADDDPARGQIVVDLAEQLGHRGEYARAEELLATAEPDPAAAPLAAVIRLDLMTRSNPHEAIREIDARLPQLLDQLTRAANHAGIAKAHLVAFERYRFASLAKSACEEARLAALHAGRAGDEGLRAQALGYYALKLAGGPDHAQAIAQQLDEIEQENPGPYLRAMIDKGRAEVSRLEGDFDESLRLTHQAIETLEALGRKIMVAGGAFVLANTYLSAGDPDAAVDTLLRSDATFAEAGERAHRSTIQAHLAVAYELLGERAAALAACDLAEQLSAPDDVVNFALTSRIRSRLALAEGDREGAEELARTAVQHAARTDDLPLLAAAKLDLARVLSALGRQHEAQAEARDALELHETKGDRPGIAEARTFLNDPPTQDPSTRRARTTRAPRTSGSPPQ